MARLNAQNRQEQIIELLNNNGSMKATELADYFFCFQRNHPKRFKYIK